MELSYLYNITEANFIFKVIRGGIIERNKYSSEDLLQDGQLNNEEATQKKERGS